jgi:hypothetical protein
MGTGSFLGVESGRGVTLTPHPLLVPRSKNRVELYLFSPLGPSWPVKRVKSNVLWYCTQTSFYHIDVEVTQKGTELLPEDGILLPKHVEAIV